MPGVREFTRQFPAGGPLLAENIPAAEGTPGSTVLETGAPDARAHLHPQRQRFMQKLRGGVEYGVGPARSSQAVTDSQKYRD